MTTSPQPAALSHVAEALAGIARTADTEITWSDHSCDAALRQIAADAHSALNELSFVFHDPGDR